MKTIIKGKDRYLLRFDRGEEVMSEFKKWAEEKLEIGKAATFTMLGASDNVVVSYYELPSKQYLDKSITEDVEVISVVGNLTWKKDDSGKMGVIVHGHGTFGGNECQVWGGHVKKLVVSITLEVSVISLDGEGEAIREMQEWCGLALLR